MSSRAQVWRSLKLFGLFYYSDWRETLFAEVNRCSRRFLVTAMKVIQDGLQKSTFNKKYFLHFNANRVEKFGVVPIN